MDIAARRVKPKAKVDPNVGFLLIDQSIKNNVQAGDI